MKKLTTILVTVFLGLISGCEEISEAQTDTTSKNQALPEKVDDTKKQPATSKVEKIVYGEKYPEVLKAKVTHGKGDEWSFSVTLSSTYDTPKRYADAWRVVDGQGKELGIRILGHDHASEQPFTRSGTVKVPANIQKVYVEGRDQANGWSGQRFEVAMPAR